MSLETRNEIAAIQRATGLSEDAALRLIARRECRPPSIGFIGREAETEASKSLTIFFFQRLQTKPSENFGVVFIREEGGYVLCFIRRASTQEAREALDYVHEMTAANLV